MAAFDPIVRNVRHAARLLLESPGATGAAVATIALGIGANTAIFSLIKTVMLGPLPYGAPERLVMIWNAADREGTTHLSIREILSYAEEAHSLARLAGYSETNANLTGEAEPERVRAGAVTANLFETLGVSPVLGRVFARAEGEPGAPEVVVLAHTLWQRRYGGAAGIIGRTIHVNGRPRTVVGVMPPSFRLPLDFRAERPTEIWYPLIIDRANLEHWGSRSYFGVGRLAPGAAASQATGEFAVIADRWVQAGFVKPSLDGGLTRAAVPIQDFLLGQLRRPLLILLGAAGVVLLIACANVVNLQLARAGARRREIAIRGALGAGRGHVVRQLLTEGVLLAVAGGVAGLALAHGAIEILVTLRPASLPRVEDAAIDPTALAVTGGLALLTGILFGLAPAMHLSRERFAALLNEGGRGTPDRRRVGVGRGLVVAQLAFSVVLVVGAGLLIRTLVELNRIELGFDPDRVLTAQLQLPASDYPDASDVIRFYRQLLDRLESVPGVIAAGGARVLPIARAIGDWSITIEGRPLATPNENPNGDFQAVTPGYFEAMGLRLLRGRFLTDGDREGAPLAVVINDTMARRYWPGRDAIGKRFQMGGPGTVLPPLTIVGLVRTSRHNAIVEEPRAEMYLAHAQLPRAVGGPGRALAIVMKTEGDPLVYAEALRQVVRSMDRNLPLADVQSMDRITAAALAGPRFAALLLGLFAGLALALAAIGTYATVSLLVSERAREIGIRMALGAGRRTILGWVLREGLGLALGGVAAGVAGALLATRLLEALLYGVTALDPATFTTVAVLLAVVAAMASLIPAHRAASVDPMSTLRQG